MRKSFTHLPITEIAVLTTSGAVLLSSLILACDSRRRWDGGDGTPNLNAIGFSCDGRIR
jgi:hypothetical protein